MPHLGRTDLDVSAICLGGNVFGWTADEPTSFAILDGFVEGGGNFIDTADSYSTWVEGNSGGESEEIIGRWLAKRGRRDDVVVATKVASKPDRLGLSPENLRRACEDSMQRLGTHIDLYYAHVDDPEVPVEDVVGTFAELIAAGKVRHVAASNFTAPRLAEALAAARARELPGYVALQTEYNLITRDGYEGELAELCQREGLPCLAYSALADGFLTGKYRPGAAHEGERAEDATGYFTPRGLAVLDALDTVAERTGASHATIALAWLVAQPGVIPIASVSRPQQLPDLLAAAKLDLSADDLALLGGA
jgi:aryl-alcohol dehydrogenase-like predicted oxidoreductase